LEAKVAEQGLILAEAQVAALEKKRQDDEVNGEIETTHPGCLASWAELTGQTPLFHQSLSDLF
jgi:hypothetical protein